MKRICVIGNSHVGALKDGFYSLDNKPYHASFWAIPSGVQPNISIKKNKIIVPKELSKKVRTDIENCPKEELDIENFDAILLSGVGLAAIRNRNDGIAKRYLVAGLISDTSTLVNRQIISKATFSQMIENKLHNTQSFKYIDKISSIFKKEIYIQQFPLPTPQIIEQEKIDLHYYGDNIGRFLSWYYQQQSRVIEKYIQDKNIALVQYPSDWIESGFTPIEYKSKNDVWHMNARFGEFFMGELLPNYLLK